MRIEFYGFRVINCEKPCLHYSINIYYLYNWENIIGMQKIIIFRLYDIPLTHNMTHHHARAQVCVYYG